MMSETVEKLQRETVIKVSSPSPRLFVSAMMALLEAMRWEILTSCSFTQNSKIEEGATRGRASTRKRGPGSEKIEGHQRKGHKRTGGE